MTRPGRRPMRRRAIWRVMARGIVGFKLAITRLEAKAKMSQNREARDRAGVVQGLTQRAQGEDAEIAALVEKLER